MTSASAPAAPAELIPIGDEAAVGPDEVQIVVDATAIDDRAIEGNGIGEVILQGEYRPTAWPVTTCTG